MTRNHIILAVLLAGSLLWAYLLSNPSRQAATASGKSVSVWEVPIRDIERIEYKNGTLSVSIEPKWREGREEPSIWITSPPRRPRFPKTPRKEPEKIKFKGNKSALRLLESLAHLKAVRGIGSLENLKAEDFGFPAPDKILRLWLRGKEEPLALEIGGTNFAKSMHYLRETSEQRVYLARRSLFRPFNQAYKKLFEKSLFPFPVDDAVRIEIKRGGIEKAIWRLKTPAGGRKQWGVSPDEETADPDLQTLVGLLRNLKVIKYLPDEKPPAPALEILFFREDDQPPPVWLKLFPVEGDRAVAISSHTEIPVILTSSQVKRFLEKSEKILSGI